MIRRTAHEPCPKCGRPKTLKAAVCTVCRHEKRSTGAPGE